MSRDGGEIRLLFLKDVVFEDGEPMPMLLVPQGPGRRAVLLTFPNVAEALEEKARREGTGCGAP